MIVFQLSAGLILLLGNLKIDFNQDDSRIIVGDKEKVDEFSFKYTFCVYRKCYINRMAGVFLILGYLAAMDAKIYTGIHIGFCKYNIEESEE